MPRIVDKFQIYLRGVRVEDLRGSDGMHRLREELLLRVGRGAGDGQGRPVQGRANAVM